MNERLAKLTEQCYEYNETMQSAWFNKTKFAELLLEECCQICIDKWVEKTSEDARDCYVAIQEHFKIGPKYEREN